MMHARARVDVPLQKIQHFQLGHRLNPRRRHQGLQARGRTGARGSGPVVDQPLLRILDALDAHLAALVQHINEGQVLPDTEPQFL
jgi:hypothetical protein